MELTGYEFTDLDDTLARARAAGVQVLRAPEALDDRTAAFVEFPGGCMLRFRESRPTDALCDSSRGDPFERLFFNNSSSTGSSSRTG